jgi:acyl-CoA synthetase (AMP-forming)/AMP-acid ligase II
MARSEQNFVGYWNQPNETARAFAADGWLRTGDLGRRDTDGRLYLVDRAADRIVSGGENIYPTEVEEALAAFPGLDQVAVIGVPSDRWGETVKAIVTARPGVAIEPADVIAFARTQLAKFKCPTSVTWSRPCRPPPPGRFRGPAYASPTGSATTAASTDGGRPVAVR